MLRIVSDYGFTSSWKTSEQSSYGRPTKSAERLILRTMSIHGRPWNVRFEIFVELNDSFRCIFLLKLACNLHYFLADSAGSCFSIDELYCGFLSNVILLISGILFKFDLLLAVYSGGRWWSDENFIFSAKVSFIAYFFLITAAISVEDVSYLYFYRSSFKLLIFK